MVSFEGSVFRIIFGAWLVLVAVAAEAAERRVALVIGNSAYANAPALPNPKQDANDVADALGRLGFEVTRRLDATGADMRRALIAFGREAQRADMAAVFFAGHGMEIGGDNWLIPVDAEMRSDADAEGEAVSLRSAMTQVAKARGLGMVILDACRNNPFANTMQRTVATRAVERGLARVEPPSDNVIVAYAARDGTTAADGTGRNSPFTSALLKNIETPGLEVRFLFSNVRDDVLKATKRSQQPFVYASLSGEQIYLKPAAASPQQPVGVPVALDDIAWKYINRDSVSSLRRFLAEYPNSAHRAEASDSIQRLEVPTADRHTITQGVVPANQNTNPSTSERLASLPPVVIPQRITPSPDKKPICSVTLSSAMLDDGSGLNVTSDAGRFSLVIDLPELSGAKSIRGNLEFGGDTILRNATLTPVSPGKFVITINAAILKALRNHGGGDLAFSMASQRMSFGSVYPDAKLSELEQCSRRKPAAVP